MTWTCEVCLAEFPSWGRAEKHARDERHVRIRVNVVERARR